MDGIFRIGTGPGAVASGFFCLLFFSGLLLSAVAAAAAFLPLRLPIFYYVHQVAGDQVALGLRRTPSNQAQKVKF